MLQQLVYVSALSEHTSDSCLKNILAEASARNPARHITGMLLYTNGSFLQVLEGMEDELSNLYEKILRDPRHSQIVKVSQLNITERDFADWSMGWAQLNNAELDRHLGKNDFFCSGHCLNELDSGLLKRLLEEFRSGLWRRRIS